MDKFEREALRVASPVTWGWDACVVCGSRNVTDRGMVVMVSKADGAYVGRIAWCDGSQECRDDLRQAGASMLTADQAEAVDATLRRSETPEPQGEPTPINGKWACGKCAREIALGHDDGQIPEHHRTCPKRTQGEPSDSQVLAALPGAPGETIELVSRPVPDLPFEAGSVIQFSGERWMLRKNGYWVSSVRPGVRDPGELKALAQEYGGFEVIV